MNNATEESVFAVGARAFFDCIDGFDSKDKDFVHLIDGWYFNQPSLLMRDGGFDHFLYPNKGLELIDECLKQNDPITSGKFLVPEFCEYIGATIEDVKRLEPLFYALDEKHRYETYIFDCYCKNGGLWLSDEQLSTAYDVYKEARE